MNDKSTFPGASAPPSPAASVPTFATTESPACPCGVRTHALSRMVRGRRRYATVGNANTMTVSAAQRKARRLIASYIEPAKKNSGPGTPDNGIRRGVPRPAGPPLETPDPGVQHFSCPQPHPPSLRPLDCGRH